MIRLLLIDMSVKIELPYFNQNLLVLIVGLVALGFAEFYKLNILFWIAIIISIFMSISVLISMVFYTIDYMTKKSGKKK